MSKVEERAINTLLSQGVPFHIKAVVLGIRFSLKFRIKQLYLGTILHISKYRLKLKSEDLVEENEIVWEMLERTDNLKVFARCISAAILNRPIKIRLFSWILSRVLISSLTVKEVYELMTVVVTQLNPKDFFLSTALVKKIEIMERTQDPSTSAKKQSGEQSEKSQKS